MLTLKNIYRYITLAHLMVLLGVFVACNEEMEYIPAAKQTLPMARVAIIENGARIETVRILIFDEKGDLVSNSGKIEVDDTNISDNILTISSERIAARVSKNHVYVILNEENVILDGVTGDLETNLNAIEKKDDMENLRSKSIKYEEIIAVEEGEEPAFLMCVYDEVDVTSSSTLLDITGLDTNDYGFSMRRTMAKVVLESVIGGVRPNGEIVGTNGTKRWKDGDELYKGNTNENGSLIATSALHILGVELINVPTHYSWKQEKELANYPVYEGEYRENPFSLASSDFMGKNGYFEREWPGYITASGNVPFTRIDNLYNMWKTLDQKGTNAYAMIADNVAEANPDMYYNWVIDGSTKPNITTDDANKIDKGIKFSHYEMVDGIIKLHFSDGSTRDAPANSTYTLNSGNFITWFKGVYSQGDTDNKFTAGTPIAGAPTDVQAHITPAVWKLKFDKKAYYIPENIYKDNNYTKLRITASIAIPTAKLDEEAVNNAIKAQGGMGNLIQDEGKGLVMTDQNIINFMFAKGEMVPHPTKEGLYALRYAGLQRKYEGSVSVEEGEGQYDAIAGMMAQKVYFEIPLNNDMVEGNYSENDYAENTYEGNQKPEGATNYNIYRGHEYRVKLYVTKSNSAWDDNQVNPASRTINIGGEELTITGKVTASPIK